jgi:fumarate reductase flavoprotein subunit
MAEGIFGAESPTQKRMGISVPRDELFNIAMDYAHWTINPRIVRALIDKSGDTVGWLEGKGVTFNLRPHPPNLKHVTWHCPENRGADIIKALAKNFVELGGRLLSDTVAKELITNSKKEVVGVLATTKKGEGVRVKADSVIISTGGYGGNKEMLKKYCPYYREDMMLEGVPNMGEGILMALKAGAATEGLGRLQAESKGVTGERPEIWMLGVEPQTLWVNKRGERFANEAIVSLHESANAVIRQPDIISFTVFDEEIKRSVMEKGFFKFLGFAFAKEKKREDHLSELPRFLQSAAERGKVKITDSWDEIAKWIGAEPETLRDTIDEYNSFCNNGYDALFTKKPEYLMPLRTPPYYAIRCGMRFHGSIGGIKINHKIEVLNHEDNPIPGLYAAGVDTGGWESETYNINLSGHAFGFAVNSGRIAGENAAKYVLGIVNK